MNYASALIAVEVAQTRYLEFESTRQLLSVGQDSVNIVIGHDNAALCAGMYISLSYTQRPVARCLKASKTRRTKCSSRVASESDVVNRPINSRILFIPVFSNSLRPTIHLLLCRPIPQTFYRFGPHLSYKQPARP